MPEPEKETNEEEEEFHESLDRILSSSGSSTSAFDDGDRRQRGRRPQFPPPAAFSYDGFRNTSSQLSASLSPNGKYVICASEDSHVYVWRYDADSWSSGGNGIVTATHSYESFPCQDVTAAAPWPITSTGGILGAHGDKQNEPDGVFKGNSQILAGAQVTESSFLSTSGYHDYLQNIDNLNTYSNNYCNRVSTTWPEEKLSIESNGSSPQNVHYDGRMQARSRSAWGMVILTAGRRGQIRTFQNFGFPVRL